MKLSFLSAVTAALILGSPVANSAVIYDFSFTNVAYLTGNKQTIAPFSVTLRYDDYVSVIGGKVLSAPLTQTVASLGWPITFTGFTGPGHWGFGEKANSFEFSDDDAFYSKHTFFFEDFDTTNYSGHYKAPGTYTGRLWGAETYLDVFQGNATLTITEEGSAVPEPGSLALLALGIAGLAVARRRQA